MKGKLYGYFEQDHKRLEELLNHAAEKEGTIDNGAYREFRAGLLRHIGLEEKVLFPAAQKALGSESFPSLPRLRLDHGALTALMVPSPTPVIVSAVRSILARHNEIEESNGGPYEVCEQLAANEIDSLLEKIRNAPQVPLLPHRDEPFVMEATKRALERAGYRLEDYEHTKPESREH